jgi:hypothetical protein
MVSEREFLLKAVFALHSGACVIVRDVGVEQDSRLCRRSVSHSDLLFIMTNV